MVIIIAKTIANMQSPTHPPRRGYHNLPIAHYLCPCRGNGLLLTVAT